MPVLAVERRQCRPTLLRLVGADHRLQDLGAVAVAFELPDQIGEPLFQRVIAHQIQPRHPPARGFNLREGRPAAADRLLHQHHQVPGQCTPRRREDRVLLSLPGRHAGINIDQE